MSYDLYEELIDKENELRKSLKELRRSGTSYAESEYNYKVRLRQEVLKMRADGEAIGVITLTCYGIPEVAELRKKRDIAKTVLEANQEAINVIKLEIKILKEQIAREWSNVDNL